MTQYATGYGTVGYAQPARRPADLANALWGKAASPPATRTTRGKVTAWNGDGSFKVLEAGRVVPYSRVFPQLPRTAYLLNEGVVLILVDSTWYIQGPDRG